MSDRCEQFEQALTPFQDDVKAVLRDLLRRRGVLPATEVGQITQRLAMPIETLMVKLLPIAAAFATAPVSGYRVGAVAAGLPVAGGPAALYLGANIELAGEALNLAVHAEQSSALNAWHAGEAGISLLAVSALPCGHCRQFLYELAHADTLSVLLAADRSAGYRAETLADLLPPRVRSARLGD